MKRDVFQASLVLALGVFIAFGILFFSDPVASFGENVSFIQKVGEGLIAPACGSSGANVTCSGGNPSVTISWTSDFNPGTGAGVCSGSEVPHRLVVSGPGGFTQDLCFSPPYQGSYTWNGASNNASYTYDVFTPGFFPWQDFSHLIASGSFTTPNCAPTYQCSDSIDNDGDGLIDFPNDPGCSSSSDNNEYNVQSVDVLGNSSNGPLTVTSGSGVTLSWSSSGVGALQASGCWSGTKSPSGSETIFPTSSTVCTLTAGSVSDSVTINVLAPDFSLTNTNNITVTIIGSSSATSTNSTVTVTPFNNFNSTVSLSVQSVTPTLPSGTQHIFSDSTLTSSEYSTGSTYHVIVPGTTATGTYSITIAGTGGGLTRTTALTLNVNITSPEFREVFKPLFNPWTKNEILTSYLPALSLLGF
ncbi:MAG: hypothetical protein Q8R12_03885 [bacterium]|nr:hypothetical protein [bacterium]